MMTKEQLAALLETYNTGEIDNNSVRMGLQMALSLMRESDRLGLPLSVAIEAVAMLHDNSIQDPDTA